MTKVTALFFESIFFGIGADPPKFHPTLKVILVCISKHSYQNGVSDFEFLRAIIFGDHEHYDPESSQVCNLFDISLPDGREHFLMILLLSFIERSSDSGEGFATASSVFRYAQDLQFAPSQIHSSLDRAVAKGLIETSPRFAPAQRWEAFRITSVGAYSVRRLLQSFSYVDAMIVDTPIVDGVVRDAVRNAQTIHQRLDRFELFLSYLENQAHKIDWSVAGYAWTGAFEGLKQDFLRARRRAGSPPAHKRYPVQTA